MIILVIPQEFIESMKERLAEYANGGTSTVEGEVEFQDYILNVSMSANVDIDEEEETNSQTINISKADFTIKLFNEDGEVDFSDEFERDIFDQLKAVEGEMILSNN
jgi:Holliday junction resolvasome RuvABC DNA-binding subunit